MPELYNLRIAPAAERQIKKLDASTRKRISNRIEELRKAPRPPGVKKLTDSPVLYRVRDGDYRIIYTIKDRLLLITIIEVGHRRDVY